LFLGILRARCDRIYYLTFTFDVFVSYAHPDRDFAVDLARQLGRLGFQVWFDEEQVPAGAPVKETVARAVGEARHAVFVITDAWLDRDWTEWELELFQADRQAGRIAIPLLRIPRDVKRLGPYLAKQNALAWPVDDPEPLARLWQVLCGLRQEPAGPRDAWSERARQALGGNGPALAARTPDEREARTVLAVRQGVHVALSCDRAAQWGALTTCAATADSQALFLYGSRGQGHDVFFERVKECLPQDPRRRIRTVDWGAQTPTAKGQFLAALAEALDHCRPEQLAATLRTQLAKQNLVLLHSPVFKEEFEDDALVDYYTCWLPELLAQAGAAPRPGDSWGLKLIQGIAWCRSSPLQSGTAWLLRRLGVGGTVWAKNALQRGDALAVLARIRRQADPRLPIVLLDELPDLRREDVEQWSLLLPMPERERERGRIVDRVMRGARDSADILQEITELYKKETRE